MLPIARAKPHLTIKHFKDKAASYLIWEQRRLGFKPDEFRDSIGFSARNWELLNETPQAVDIEHYIYALNQYNFTVSLPIIDTAAHLERNYATLYKVGKQRQAGLDITGVNLFEMTDEQLKQQSKESEVGEIAL